MKKIRQLIVPVILSVIVLAVFAGRPKKFDSDNFSIYYYGSGYITIAYGSYESSNLATSGPYNSNQCKMTDQAGTSYNLYYDPGSNFWEPLYSTGTW